MSDLRRIRNNLVTIMAQAENAMTEIDALMNKPTHEGPTETLVVQPTNVCGHPVENRKPATTMGDGPEQFYCNKCGQQVEGKHGG